MQNALLSHFFLIKTASVYIASSVERTSALSIVTALLPKWYLIASVLLLGECIHYLHACFKYLYIHVCLYIKRVRTRKYGFTF